MGPTIDHTRGHPTMLAHFLVPVHWRSSADEHPLANMASVVIQECDIKAP